MKRFLPLLLIGTMPTAQAERNHVNFIRQEQQTTGVRWDMPLAPIDQAPAALLSPKGGTLFQLWSIERDNAADHLIDQKIVGPYLPSAGIRVRTLDPYEPVARTRVDQPFTVEINVSGLLTGLDFPKSATHVVLERHIARFPKSANAPPAAAVISGVPVGNAYINTNGTTILKFPASSLTARDATKASGEEHFVIHALSDGSLSHTQLASGFVQVWPIASGALKGITHGDVIRSQAPEIELRLNDLYPRSDTSLMLFEGTQINGVEGASLCAFSMDREISADHAITVNDLDKHIAGDGTYTLVLVSDTIYGRELLCDPLTFSVNRGPNANAMQANLNHQED